MGLSNNNIHILHVYTENTGPPAAEGKASGRNERSMKIYTSLRSMKIYTSLKKNDTVNTSPVIPVIRYVV